MAASMLTYEIEELLGTKMRALFQRKKGRDLYDLAIALKHFPNLDQHKTVHCFRQDMDHGKTLDSLSMELRREFSSMKGISPRNLKYMRDRTCSPFGKSVTRPPSGITFSRLE